VPLSDGSARAMSKEIARREVLIGGAAIAAAAPLPAGIDRPLVAKRSGATQAAGRLGRARQGAAAADNRLDE